MATIDESGNPVPDEPKAADLPPNVRNLGDARKKRTRKARGNMAGNINDGRDTSFGARAWEFLHPGEVQKEYEAVGATPPSQWEVMRDAAGGMATAWPDAMGAGIDQAAEGLETVATAGLSIGKIALIGLGIYIFLEVTADRRLKRYNGD